MENDTPTMGGNRRDFLKRIGGAAVSTVAIGTVGIPAAAQKSLNQEITEKFDADPEDATRKEICRQVRVDAAQSQFDEPPPNHLPNSDEIAYANRIGSFSKALPQMRTAKFHPSRTTRH